jgi:hypothetical protein
MKSPRDDLTPLPGVSNLEGDTKFLSAFFSKGNPPAGLQFK